MEKFAPVKRSEDGQPVRYLIVDDSVFARKNLARMVESFGGQVVGEAGDGISAISEYERLTPDIVLMDITMPQMEGIEAAEKIVRDHPSARIVMVTSERRSTAPEPELERSHAHGTDSAFHQLGRRRFGAGAGVAHFHREPEHGTRGLPAERDRCRGLPHGRN